MTTLRRLAKRVAYTALARTNYLRRRTGSGLAVVTYHGVVPARYRSLDPVLDFNLVRPESFRRQLNLLKERYSVITPEEFRAWCGSDQALPQRAVLLTCDDGLRTTMTEMVPVLQQLDLSCLFFVTSASLEDRPGLLWYDELHLMLLTAPRRVSLQLDDIAVNQHATGRGEKRALWRSLVRQLSQYDAGNRNGILRRIAEQLGLRPGWDAAYRIDPAGSSRFLPLSLSELRQLAAAGMCVGAHTVSHPVLAVSPPELAWQEITDNRRGLEQALGQSVWAFAYPFGDPTAVTPREVEMAERAGFQCAFRNGGGGFGADLPRFGLPRVNVSADMSIGEFEAHVSGIYRAVPWRRGDT
jgi:peptidoglycan/xylan/chitin deacetylase (PgdA/CDA1 family)